VLAGGNLKVCSNRRAEFARERLHVPQAARELTRMLRWLGIGLVILAGCACVLLLIALLVNARDEAPSAEVRALLTPPPNPYAAADNIYVALQGFDAPPAESVIAAGEARIARYNSGVAAALRDPSLANLDRLTLRDAHRLAFKGDISFIRPLESSVWNEAPQHEQQIVTLLADNDELMQRYLNLITLHGYYETARPSALAPSASPPHEVRRLFLAKLALEMRARGRLERRFGLAQLEGDIRLWRGVLTGEGTLPWKMLALAFLQSDYLLLADLIADPNVELDPREEYADALVPLFAAKDFDLGTAFAAEFRIQVAALRDPEAELRGSPAGWLERAGSRMTDHFLKPNATENLLASDTRSWMAAAADPAQFFRMTAAAEPRVWLLPLSYNPLGRFLSGTLTQPYRHYPPRAWDQAALQRLVRAGYEVRLRRLTPAALPAFLRSYPQWSTHPADGRPFVWNAAGGELRVQTLAQHPPGWRFDIHLWRPLAPPAADR
jgi:hypothetical protein